MQHHGLFLLHLPSLVVIETSLAHVGVVEHGLQGARVHTAHGILEGGRRGEREEEQGRETIHKTALKD